MPTDNSRAELLQGTLGMLILKVLTSGPNHGYGIARRIKQLSVASLTVEEGSLYPALHRLAKRGLVEFEWRSSELNRRAKYYRLTDAGRTYLANEMRDWQVLSRAIERVLNWSAGTEGGPATEAAT